MPPRAYTDGACRGNPGPGGWGVVLETGAGAARELRGAAARTTNNRMELQAVIEALDALPAGTAVEVVTDSEYVMKGITEWIGRWKRNGWRTAGGKPVRNRELWQNLDRLAAAREVAWRWVRGHSGVAGNERADALANQAIDELPAP